MWCEYKGRKMESDDLQKRMMQNRLILGDNLEVLKTIPSKSVDLCYIDPPFFSNRNYEVIWGDEGEIASFTDRWAGGMDHYIGWLKERIEEIWRVLKKTGTLYVHCDWHADAYIRVHILDKLGGKFANQIIWRRTNAHNDAQKKMPILTDTIWRYTKSNDFMYNPIYIELNKKYINDFYKYEDENGVFRLDNLRSPSHRPNLIYNYKGYKPHPNGWAISKEKMEELDRAGLLQFPKSQDGRITLKRYLNTSKGMLIGNLWDDISPVSSQAKERIGYPTQKPLALMERIIKASSNEGDVVLDAFCGGGTTLVAAAKLGRRFIGIDQSVQAIAVSQARLENTMEGEGIADNPIKNKQKLLFGTSFVVERHKYDYDSIRNQPALEFEQFIIRQFGGVPNAKQRGDLGIDGEKRKDKVSDPIQVKRSENVGRNVIDNFKSAMARFSKNCKRGYIIAFSFGKGAVEEVARLKREEDINIELVRVDSIIPVAAKPHIRLAYDWRDVGDRHDKEVTFIATGNGIELWQWDWDYQPQKGFKGEVLMDKVGKQTHLFCGGTYEVAVRGVDTNGIESIESLHFVANGGIHSI
jgi:DNA modification methylase